MHEDCVQTVVLLPADQQSLVIAEPRNCPCDNPAVAIAAQGPAVLERWALSALAMGADRLDAARPEPEPEPVCIVRPIDDQAFHLPPRGSAVLARYAHRGERLLDECGLSRIGRRDGHSQRNTLAVCHHQPLRTLSAFCVSDCVAPFFAGEKLASVKHCSQSRVCRSSSSASQARSHTPDSSQSRNRRQQVLGEGYGSGRSFQRAPLRNTQRMPSKQGRFGAASGRLWARLSAPATAVQ